MALTQGAWSVTSKNGFTIATCSVVQTTGEKDAYTLRTPKEIDGTRPFTLILVPSAACDGSALPVDIWGGTDETAALTGDDTTVAGTKAFKLKQILDDASGTDAMAIDIDPALGVADVVAIASIASGLKVRVPSFPFYIFNLNGGGALNAATMTYYIIQKGAS